MVSPGLKRALPKSRAGNSSAAMLRALSRTLVELARPWNSLFMTTTVDKKQRAVTPFKPGDVLEVEQQSPDVVVLKRTKQVDTPKAKLERRNGRLVFVGEPITTDDVKGLLEDFP